MEKEDWNKLEKLFAKATYSELIRIRLKVQKEIDLSKTAIEEGFEEDR